MEAMKFTTEACGGLWRSEDMMRLDVVIQREALHDTVYEIGALGKAQFVDMNEGNAAFARPFTNEIRRCDELQRKMNLIEQELVKERDLLERYKDYHMSASVQEVRDSAITTGQLDMIDERAEATVTALAAMMISLRGLYSEMNVTLELTLLARRVHGLTHQHNSSSSAHSLALSPASLRDSLAGAQGTSMESGHAEHALLSGVSLENTLTRLSTLLGICAAEKAESLYKLCYRVTRGNALIDMSNEPVDFVNPATGERGMWQVTFTVFSASAVIIGRLRKLVAAQGATVYSLEEVLERVRMRETGGYGRAAARASSPYAPMRNDMSADNDSTIDGTSLTANNSTRNRVRVDSEDRVTFSGEAEIVAAARQQSQDLALAARDVLRRRRILLHEWYVEHRVYKTYIAVEKAVLTMMNMCALSGATCTASLWVPCRHVTALHGALDAAVASSGAVVRSVTLPHPSQLNPPTHFDTNKYTESFQSIVDSYGMARYKEVNPGVFTIITFPYLFGIMYGDMGHALLLLIIAVFFISRERSWRLHELNEIVAMIFGGRYLLLLMSLFALYMGVLYNDFFGFSVNLFSSGYTWAPARAQQGNISYPTVPDGQPSVKPPSVYAFGLDVAWAETENKLEFYNSVKMKHAVIVGVVQMFAGLLLSLQNSVYERNWERIYYLFIPEFVFLLCTFGYMSILIMVKWCTTWDNTHNAPSILEIMTNFFLQPGTVPMPLFRGQAGLQIFLLLVAFAMVPVMLLGMPVVEYRRYQAWRTQRQAVQLAEMHDRDPPKNNTHLVPRARHNSSFPSSETTNSPASTPLDGQNVVRQSVGHGVAPRGHAANRHWTDELQRDDWLDTHNGDSEDGGDAAHSHAYRSSYANKVANYSNNNTSNMNNNKYDASALDLHREEGGNQNAGGQRWGDDVTYMRAGSLYSEHDPSTHDMDGNEFEAIMHEEEEAEGRDRVYAEFDLSEMIIHYVIHTIEYVLSSVSNTASYLRLWALSLAHAQLSEVFFSFAVVNTLDVDNTGVGIAVGSIIWLAATLGVLVGMEALSAFLHALRLHWVEFQNKFYKGDGRPLEPFDIWSIH